MAEEKVEIQLKSSLKPNCSSSTSFSILFFRKQEEKTPSEADEKSNGDQSPKSEAEDEKPCSSEQTSKDDEGTSPVRPKPAIITYHYTPRTGPYKPRGRGRGRGRPPGSGRKVIDQSEDAPTVSSNSKDVEKEDTSTFKVGLQEFFFLNFCSLLQYLKKKKKHNSKDLL